MQLDERSSNSLSLSWTVSRKAAHNRYQLMYRKKVSTTQELDSTHKSLSLHFSAWQQALKCVSVAFSC